MQQQPVHGFVYVTGLDGAKAYQMPPNSEMPLFDSTGDIMYIKTTDGAGFPTITICDCKKREPMAGGVATQEYVTRDELDRTYRDLSEQLERIKESMHGFVPTTTAAAQPAACEVADIAADNGWQSPRHASAANAQ